MLRNNNQRDESAANHGGLSGIANGSKRMGAVVNLDNTRDLGKRPKFTMGYGAEVPTGTELAKEGDESKIASVAQTPALEALNNALMVPTQLVYHSKAAGLNDELRWDSFPFEALDRRANLQPSGRFAYSNALIRQKEFSLPERVVFESEMYLGGYCDGTNHTLVPRGGAGLPFAGASPACSPIYLSSRPQPPTPDNRPYVAEADVLTGPENGSPILVQQVKTFNHVLSMHRYFGARGLRHEKEEWKTLEAERLRRVEELCRLASHGQSYVRMFFKLLMMYYDSLINDRLEGQMANSVRTTVHGYGTATSDAISTPEVKWCDANAPRFSVLGVRVFCCNVAIAARAPQIVYDYAVGIYVYSEAAGSMVRYDSMVELRADWPVMAHAAAAIAAGEVQLRVAELSSLAKNKSLGVQEYQPHEVQDLAIGGEEELWQNMLQVHNGEALLFDIEGVPDDVVRAWLLACCARTHTDGWASVAIAGAAATGGNPATASVAGGAQTFLSNAAQTRWARAVPTVYLHSGGVDVETYTRAYARVPLANSVGGVAHVATQTWFEALRWLVVKTGAEADFFQADELATALLGTTPNSTLAGMVAATQVNNVTHSCLAGYQVALPKDFTLPAYFYPFKEQAALTARSEHWLGLLPHMRLNYVYYKNIMLQVSTTWACWASSMTQGCWGTVPAAGAGPEVVARHKHGVEITRRAGAYSCSVLDMFMRNACAHMYGWAPSKEMMLALDPWRRITNHAIPRVAVHRDALLRVHASPGGVHAYTEAWLVRMIPDLFVLPTPDGTVKWPSDKPRPTIDGASDHSRIRVGATLAPLDYRYWLSDGGQIMSLQYYVSSNASNDPTGQLALRSSGADNHVHLGWWPKPHEYEWPTGANTVDPVAQSIYETQATFVDYIAPNAMCVYDHHRRVPRAWGAQRVTATGVHETGSVYSWYKISQANVGIAPTFVYEAPTWGVRESEPLSDYYVAALVDVDEGRFLGMHWASLASLSQGRGSEGGGSSSFQLTRMKPISHPAALANDNSPNAPKSAGGGYQRKAPLAKMVNRAFKQSKQKAALAAGAAAEPRVVDTPKDQFSAYEVEELPGKPRDEVETPEVGARIVTPAQVNTAAGELKSLAMVKRKGGNKSDVRDLPVPKTTLTGRIKAGGAGSKGDGYAITGQVTPSATPVPALLPAERVAISRKKSFTNAPKPSVMAKVRSSLIKRVAEARAANSSPKARWRAMGDLALDIEASLIEGDLTPGEVEYVLREVPTVLEKIPVERQADMRELVRNVSGDAGALALFGEEEVEVYSDPNKELREPRSVKLTDEAAYETQMKVYQLDTSWQPPPIQEGGGLTVEQSTGKYGLPYGPDAEERLN